MNHHGKLRDLISLFSLVVLLGIASVDNACTAEPKFALKWGDAGDEPGQFHSPIGIAVNKDDEVFVADLNNARLQRFCDKGEYLGEIELPRDDPDRKQALIGGMAFTADG